MTNDPNIPPYQQNQNQNQNQPQPPQFGQYPQQQDPNQPFAPPYQQAPFQQPQFGTQPPQPPYLQQGPTAPKGPFGVSFWIVASLLALVVLSNMATGNGETILIVLGVAALATGLYCLMFKRRSWAFVPNRNVAVAVLVAGAASLLVGGIAAGVSGAREAKAAQPVTSAELEADAAAKLKVREDAVVKSEDAVKKAEEAVKTREGAVTGTEKAAVAQSIHEGIWTVGKDIEPGDYRTTKAVVNGCSWTITRTGSNGSDYIDYDFNVKGGFPMVTLAEGHTFETGGCGDWAKQ